jgi:hypothetical protein
MTAAAKPKPVAPYSLKDETDLLWYHGCGQTSFERSTMGSMLDRANQFGMKHHWPREAVLNAAGATIGWESAITARPTAETRAVSGYIPDDQALTRYAHVSSLMLRVERVDRLAAAVIALFFGELGNRWALGETGHGRTGALYHLTAKGQALVTAASKDPRSVQLTAQARIESLAIANKVKATEERSAALAVCSRQAERLEVEARAVWHEVRGER